MNSCKDSNKVITCSQEGKSGKEYFILRRHLRLWARAEPGS